MMRILVTGGSGFIGTELTKRLRAAGHWVRVLDPVAPRTEVDDYIDGRVEDPDSVRDAVAGIDAVYHLAAEHADDVRPISRYYTVNVDGTRELLSACTEAGVLRLVFTSTVALYGLQLDGATEDTPAAPFNDYGASKWQAEGVIDEWLAADAMNGAVIVRPTVVFGPGNRGNVYNLLAQVARGRTVVIGSGRNRKSMAFVGNVADFLVSCLDSEERKLVVNYADKPDLTTVDLVHLAARELDAGRVWRIPYPLGLALGYAFDLLAWISRRQFPVSSIRVRKYCASSVIEAGQVAALGFKPKHSLSDGLVETIRSEF